MSQQYDPNSEEALLTTAMLYFNRRELQDTERVCTVILRRNPRQPAALHLIGLAVLARGDARAAQDWLTRAAALQPDPEVLVDLSDALVDNGDLQGALRCCKDALALSPLHARALHQQGLVYLWMKNSQAAVVSLRDAVRLDVPDSAIVRVDLGRALIAAGDYRAARAELEAVLGHKSFPVDALVFCGIACHELGDFTKAIECLNKAASLEKNPSDTLCNLANVYRDAGDFSRAAEHYERAMALAPGNMETRNDFSHALLANGQFERGWEFYESRWEANGWKDRGLYKQPAWQGEPLAGKRLLVWGEQGIGDQMLFAGILPEVQAQAQSCALVCDPKLVSLLARSFPAMRVAAANSPDHAAMLKEPFDYQIPMASLGQFFRRRFEDFPQHTGYLRADPAKVEAWKQRLAALGPGKKVAISWRGGFVGTRRHLRSIDLEAWLPILKTPGVEFISLQYTDCAAEIAELREKHGVVLHHWQEAIDDYDETAALVCALDRVVSVCTALIHLTGALGRTAWILVPAVPEWRYMREGERMPWYPAARLFRQARIGEWGEVFERVAGELRA